MLPHPRVHGRRDEHRRGGGQAGGGEQIVGDASGKFRHQIGRGGGDDHHIRPTRQLDVPHGRFRLGVPQIRARFLACHGLQCGGGNEPLGVFRQDRDDLCIHRAQMSHELWGLVRRDPAADAE